MNNKRIIEGLELKSKAPDSIREKSINHRGVFFKGTTYDLPLVPPIFSQHILFSGGIGSGKTNAINQVVQQLINLRSKKDVVIIFDSKGDFLQTFGKKIPDSEKVVISNDNAATAIWNMFNETLIDYQPTYSWKKSFNENLMELANNLFQTIIEKDTSNPFFPLAAKNIFYGLLKLLANMYLNDHVQGSRTKINNKMIYELSKLDSTSIANKFNEPANQKELAQLISYLGRIKPDKTGQPAFFENDQGASVVATLRNVLIDIFKGKFSDVGDFSIRDFVRKKGGKFLFIEYDLDQGRVLGPIYKTMVDLAIKESLCRERSDGNVFFVIDEFRLLPKLDYMDAGVNLGRGLGAKFIVGIQNLKQIEAIYGEAEAKSILSGFVTNVNFRTTDMETREYIKSLSGDQIYEYDVMSLSGGRQREKSSVITDESILKLNVGEAIVNIPVLDKNPIKFQFKEFKG